MGKKKKSSSVCCTQVNKCTIVSPEMTISKLTALLRSAGLGLVDVKIKPIRGRQKKPKEVFVMGTVDFRDVTNGRRWITSDDVKLTIGQASPFPGNQEE